MTDVSNLEADTALHQDIVSDKNVRLDSEQAYSAISTCMSESFMRLRWTILPTPEIFVEDDPDSLTTTLSPFLDHPIASEPATESPLREIALVIEPIEEVEVWDYEECDVVRPKPLLVRRADGGVITIADVVEQFSAYCVENKDLLLEAKAPFLQVTHEITEDGQHVIGIPAYEDVPAPPDTKVVFEGFQYGIEEGFYEVPVNLWAEGEEGKSLEYFWKSRIDESTYPM
jgi:hypothetical protein